MLESLAKLAGKTLDVGKDMARALLGGNKVPTAVEDGSVTSQSSSNDILGAIYKLMVRAREFELLKRIEEERTHNKEIADENARNDAIVKALTVRRRKQPTKAPEPAAPTPAKPAPQPAPARPAPVRPAPTVKPPSATKIITGAAIAGTAALVGKEALAANISKYESGTAGYNAYNKGTVGNKMIPSDKPIDFSKMTISEYLRRGSLKSGDPDRLFAVGRYQIIPMTMKDLVKSLKIDPDTTYLDPPTQDALFNNGLVGTRRKKVDDYVKGKSDDRDGAILQLAQEFASVGIPYDMNVGGKQLRRGDSYYSGVGGNKAHNSPDEVGAALDADRLKNTSKTTTVPPPPSGIIIDKSSKENKDLKNAAAVKQPINVNNTNVTQNQTVSSQTYSEEEFDDRAPYFKK